MFKYEYVIVNKYDLSENAGYHIIIDSEYDYIEFFYLNNKNKITLRKEYLLSNDLKSKIEYILFNYKEEIFNLNSFIYLEGINKHKEQTFIFELNDLNRKIEGYNIYSNHLLVTIFNEIKKVLEDIININLY